MIKKTITYTDYNGVERTEDFYFNLTKAEATEIEANTPGGLVDMVDRIVKAQDMGSLVKIFKELILKSYGEKSADGKMFVKIDPNGYSLANNFAQTEAYSILFTELATDADEAAKFFNGVIPNVDNNQKAVPAPPNVN